MASFEALAAPPPTGLGVAPRADSLEGVTEGTLGVAEAAAGVAILGVAPRSILLFAVGGAGFSFGLGVALDEKLELTLA